MQYPNAFLALTPNFLSYILLSGMKLERSILKPFCRTAICIILMLFISIGLSFGGALADNCQGGADCLNCVELLHRHVPGATAGMEEPDCRTTGQDSTCGFEANQNLDEFPGIVSSVRPHHQTHTGIFAAVSDEYVQTRLTGEFVTQFLLSASGGTVPIYLLNQSQLC